MEKKWIMLTVAIAHTLCYGPEITGEMREVSHLADMRKEEQRMPILPIDDVSKSTESHSASARPHGFHVHDVAEKGFLDVLAPAESGLETVRTDSEAAIARVARSEREHRHQQYQQKQKVSALIRTLDDQIATLSDELDEQELRILQLTEHIDFDQETGEERVSDKENYSPALFKALIRGKKELQAQIDSLGKERQRLYNEMQKLPIFVVKMTPEEEQEQQLQREEDIQDVRDTVWGTKMRYMQEGGFTPQMAEWYLKTLENTGAQGKKDIKNYNKFQIAGELSPWTLHQSQFYNELRAQRYASHWKAQGYDDTAALDAARQWLRDEGAKGSVFVSRTTGQDVPLDQYESPPRSTLKVRFRGENAQRSDE